MSRKSLRESLDFDGTGGAKLLATTEESSKDSTESPRYSNESQSLAPVLPM